MLKRYRELRKQEREQAQQAQASGGEGTNAADYSNDDQNESVRKVRVSEDFPDRVRKVRSLLISFLDQAIKSGKDAYLRYDKLIANGYAYEYNYTKQRPVPVVK